MGSATINNQDLGIDPKDTASLSSVMGKIDGNTLVHDNLTSTEILADTISLDAIAKGTLGFASKVQAYDLPPTFAQNVVEFNREILGIQPRIVGTLIETEFEISKKCLNEEITEFIEAYQKGDIVGMIDAMTDLKYFADGILYKMGLTAESIDKIGAAVHNANMTKKKGVNARRGDGSAADAVKPEGWVPPEERIANIIDEQLGLA